MKIIDLINENLIDLELNGENKEEALNSMIDIVYANGNIENKEVFSRDVFNREKDGTTGIGLGLAIPHGKSVSVKKECFAVGKPRRPLEWDSLDGTPVELIILLAVPDKDASTTHIKLLSKLSYYLMDDDFRQNLIAAKSKSEVINLINKKEEE